MQTLTYAEKIWLLMKINMHEMDPEDGRDPVIDILKDKLDLKNLQEDIMAAECYLRHWQLGEKPNNPNDANYIGDDEAERDRLERVSLGIELRTMGYDHPDSVVYDNEGIPIVKWKDSDFDAEQFIMNDLHFNDEQ